MSRDETSDAPREFRPHNHAHCVADALAAADQVCAAAGARMTPVRRRTLEILLEGHRPMGAYDILEVLRAEGLGSQPPVAYRALDFLVSHGFAHRIERLNAFTACAYPGAEHAPAFLICRLCRTVAEASAAPRAQLDKAAAEAGFLIERAVIEAEGLCPDCRNAA